MKRSRPLRRSPLASRAMKAAARASETRIVALIELHARLIVRAELGRVLPRPGLSQIAREEVHAIVRAANEEAAELRACGAVLQRLGLHREDEG